MCLPRLGVCLFLILCGYGATAHAQLRFAPVTMDGNRTKLALSGADTNRVLFESSLNLSNWTLLFLATPTNGTFNLVDPGLQDPTAQQFYRARILPPPSSSGKRTVIPTVDTNRAVSTLVDREGTDSYLFLDNGGRFTLTFPPNTATVPQVVTMTQVTNLAGLPFSSGIIGAVRIDLTDTLFGAPTLEMTLGANTNINQRHIVSFASDSDGTRFRLTLNRVESNTVVLVPLGPGIYGSCLATAEEVDQMFRQNGPLPTSRSSPPKVGLAAVRPSDGFLNASEICFPERVEQARKADRLIREDLQLLSEFLAGTPLRGLEGQLIAPPDPSILAQELGRIACLFFENEIKPLLGAVANNCALLTVLARHTLALSRQVALLGDENCPALLLPTTSLPVCPGARACFEEIKRCCAEHPELRELFLTDLLGLARQQALLGIESQTGCFDLGDADVQQLLEGCGSGPWTGTVTVDEFHETFSDYETTSTHFELASHYDGVVGGVANTSGSSLGLELSGQFSYSRRRVDIQKETCRNPFRGFSGCGPGYTVDETFANGKRSGLVALTVDNQGTNSTYMLRIVLDFDPGQGVPGVPQTTTYYSNSSLYRNCETCAGSIYRTSRSTYISPVAFDHSGKTDDPDTITGSLTVPIAPTNGKITYSWKLVRTKSQ